MRTVLALAAAVAINASALAALEWNVVSTEARLAPTGEVTVVQMELGQLEAAAPVAPLAQAKVEGQVVRTAGSSL